MKMRTKPVEVDVVHLTEGSVHPFVFDDPNYGLRLIINSDGDSINITYGMYIISHADGTNCAVDSIDDGYEVIQQAQIDPSAWWVGMDKTVAELRDSAKGYAATGEQRYSDVMESCAKRIDSIRWRACESYMQTRSAYEPKSNESSPEDLRELGLVVAIHNDYRQHGKKQTFWLFVDKDNMSYKGEGETDALALNQVRALLSSKS